MELACAVAGQRCWQRVFTLDVVLSKLWFLLPEYHALVVYFDEGDDWRNPPIVAGWMEKRWRHLLESFARPRGLQIRRTSEDECILSVLTINRELWRSLSTLSIAIRSAVLDSARALPVDFKRIWPGMLRGFSEVHVCHPVFEILPDWNERELLVPFTGFFKPVAWLDTLD